METLVLENQYTIHEPIFGAAYAAPNIGIAPDKAAYCVFTQFRGPENAIKLISVCTKTQ